VIIGSLFLQGSVATQIGCGGGIFSNRFITNFP